MALVPAVGEARQLKGAARALAWVWLIGMRNRCLASVLLSGDALLVYLGRD